MSKFKVGDRVTWSSQAGGFTAEKTGVVVALVPAGRGATESLPYELKRMALPRRYDGWPRDHESYVIKVKVGKMDNALPVLYWPRVSGLKLAQEQNTIKG